MQAERFIVRWITRDEQAVVQIRKYFGMPCYTTVNGFSPAEIQHDQIETFLECERRHFFQIIRKKWTFNGAQYIF